MSLYWNYKIPVGNGLNTSNLAVLPPKLTLVDLANNVGVLAWLCYAQINDRCINNVVRINF